VTYKKQKEMTSILHHILKLFHLIFLTIFYPIKNFVNILIPLKYKVKSISNEIIVLTGSGTVFFSY
jgi:hypothetical protein